MNAVLVIDMLVGFLEQGRALYVGDKARGIIPNVQRLLERQTALGASVFFVSDHHVPDDLEFQMFPPHCVVGTAEAEVISELARYQGEVIPKRRYSGFFGTDLDRRLKRLKPEKIIVCGVLTNICVLYTVADARNRDYAVEVPMDCVASPDEGDHACALRQIEKVLGARLTSANDYQPR